MDECESERHAIGYCGPVCNTINNSGLVDTVNNSGHGNLSPTA